MSALSRIGRPSKRTLYNLRLAVLAVSLDRAAHGDHADLIHEAMEAMEVSRRTVYTWLSYVSAVEYAWAERALDQKKDADPSV